MGVYENGIVMGWSMGEGKSRVFILEISSEAIVSIISIPFMNKGIISSLRQGQCIFVSKNVNEFVSWTMNRDED